MSYTELGIINLGLSRLGVRLITAGDWTTPVTEQAMRAAAVWPYVRDEVLEAKDWKFAKVTVALEQRYESPDYNFDYAYALPPNFLRLCRPKDDNPVVYPADLARGKYPYAIQVVRLPEGLEKITNGSFTGAATGWTLGTGWTYGTNNVVKASGAVNTLSQLYGTMVSAPVVGETYLLQPEIISILGGSLIPSVGGAVGEPVSTIGVKRQYLIAESATSGVVFTPSSPDLEVTIDNVSLIKVVDKWALLTDYDNSGYDLYIAHISRITDVSKYPPSFINALAWRLAQELSIPLKEAKFEMCEAMYEKSLIRADAFSSSLDSLEDETGSDDWESAGR
jgi:hypothetical protein